MRLQSIAYWLVLVQVMVWGWVSPSRAADEPVNLAQGKTATASGQEGDNFSAAMAVDGDPQTRWSSQFNDDQWLQIDLGSAQKISKVALMWEAAYGTQYKIQVSEDEKNWKDVASVTDGKGGEVAHEFAPVMARYVRMQGIKRATEWGYSLFEFKVYAAK